MLPGYATKQENICVHGVDNLQIRSLLDRNQFFDPTGDAEILGISSATWPLFGLLWPSAMQLAARIALRPINEEEHILEVGCGLALASIVAHRRGAHATASDCHPLAAGFLQHNLRLNGLPHMPYVHGQWGAAAVPTQLATKKYGLVVGSDVLYERDAKGNLAQYIADQVAPIAEVWIIDPDRNNRSAFSQRMAMLGFSHREERLNIAITEHTAAYKGRLITYLRSG